MSTNVAVTELRISDADLRELMGLIAAADSVELKVMVPTSAHRAMITNLPIDPVEAQPRQVIFFDTPELALDAAGLVVRARRIAGGRGDTVVKLRPVVPADLSPEIRRSGSFNVEVDAMPGGFVCSGSMKGKSTGAAINQALAGTVPISKLFSKEQRQFYRAHAPAGIELDSLIPLGPTFLLKAVFQPAEMARRFVAEVWFYPDGSRILELSTKCLPNEAFQVAAETRAYLSGHGLVVGGLQQTKTRAALEYFKSQLDAEPDRLA